MKHRLQAGFTLLEVLIALSLFSVGMLSVLEIFPVNRRFLTQSAQSTQAAFLAEELMERDLTLPYSSLTPGTFQAATQVSTTAGDPRSLYTRSSVVTLLDSNWQATATDVGLKRLDITVTWNEHGVSRTYVLSTIVYTDNPASG